MNEGPARPRPWMLFAVPAAIAVLIIAGFLLGGPMLGFPVAAVVAIVIVGVAIRKEPRGWPSASAPAPDREWLRAAARRFLVQLAVAVVGIVLVVAWGGVVRIIGWGVIGIAVTIALSLVFLEVGYSEDRARPREQPPPDEHVNRA
jgi:hypothetical protein